MENNNGTVALNPVSTPQERNWLSPSEQYFAKGIMQEAIKVVITYGFDSMQIHTLEAVIDPANIASKKLLIKNGFVKEGHFLENELWQRQWLDCAIYTLHGKNRVV
jgi:[ribosomal protein S5]-alanine N-acetyltransferase